MTQKRHPGQHAVKRGRRHLAPAGACRNDPATGNWQLATADNEKLQMAEQWRQTIELNWVRTRAAALGDDGSRVTTCLAQRSAQAAREIKELIDASVERVGLGTSLVAQAGRTMEDVVASIQRGHRHHGRDQRNMGCTGCVGLRPLNPYNHWALSTLLSRS